MTDQRIRVGALVTAILFTVLVAGIAAAGDTTSESYPGDMPVGGATKGARAPGVTPVKELDINTATKESLAQLPGVTPDEAQRIIDHRPYGAAYELKGRQVVSDQTWNRIKDLVYASRSNTRESAPEHK
jgi:DNA uptake protein ComE-like DNA-binding protein